MVQVQEHQNCIVLDLRDISESDMMNQRLRVKKEKDLKMSGGFRNQQEDEVNMSGSNLHKTEHSLVL